LDLSPLRKLLGMIVAIAAMVLLAPLAASAHEGHGQGRAGASVVHAMDHADHASASHIAAQSPGAVLAMPDISGSADEGACVSGCCFNMGCCGATLLVEAPRLYPPVGLPLLVPDRPTARSSALTLSLLEPPNLLA
jgi:hypothetical protein